MNTSKLSDIGTGIDEFRKGVAWHKSFDTWCGVFTISRTLYPRGFSYSVHAMQGEAARTAKPTIIDTLYKRVREFCVINNISFADVISARIDEIKGRRG